MNSFSKLCSVSTLAVVVFITSLTSAPEIQAQSLTRREQRLVDMLADGILPMTDLTRAQQLVFGPRVNQELFDTAVEAQEALEDIVDQLMTAPPSGFDLELLLAEFDANNFTFNFQVNAQDFVSDRILFGRPRAPQRAFTVRELLARGRARSVPAIDEGIDPDLLFLDPLTIVRPFSPRRIAASIALSQAANETTYDLSLLRSPEVLLASVGSLIFDTNGAVLPARATRLTNAAAAAVSVFLKVEFGL